LNLPERAQGRAFSDHELPALTVGLTVRRSPIQGQGVFTRDAISPHAVILHLDDSRVIDLAHPLRPEDGESELHRDFLPDGTVILMQSPERYINHCCEPNCYIYSANRDRFLLSRRAISPEEELLVDYSLNAVDGDVWECRCGAVTCRGRHKCDFFALPAAVQRESLPYLDPWFSATHALAIQKLLMDSCVTC